MKKHYLKHSLIWIAILAFAWTLPAKADFKVGEHIFVMFPSGNIKDDAFIVGIVKSRLENGDYQIRVLDYMQGHDYGLSCVPMREDEFGQATEVTWEAWKDTTRLYGKGMQYQVPQENVLNLDTGKFKFIERNNLLISYSRWKSNAPIMPIHLFNSMIDRAENTGLTGMIPAIQLAMQERKSYYDSETGRPFWDYETIAPLSDVLKNIITLLEDDSKLNALWSANPRDRNTIKQSSADFFLISTIDKILKDAIYQSTEEGMEKVDPAILAQFKDRLETLRSKRASRT